VAVVCWRRHRGDGNGPGGLEPEVVVLRKTPAELAKVVIDRAERVIGDPSCLDRLAVSETQVQPAFS
jgi:hypothetical protein